MQRYPTWKVVAVILMTLLALLIVVPSALGPERREALAAHLPSWFPMRAIVLGLDLQGGSHVLLQVDAADVTKTMIDNLRDDVRRTLRDEKVPIAGGIGVNARGVQFRVPDAGDRARAIPKLRALGGAGGAFLGNAAASIYDVTDSGNGVVQIAVTEGGITDKVRRAVDQSIEVLRRRVDALGTTEPNIQREGNDRILVEVPGLQDPQRLKDILGTTAKLEFRLVAEPGANANDVDQLDQTDQPGKIGVEKRVMVQGEDLTDAQPGFDQRTQEPVVNFRFNIRGGQQFGGRNVRQCRASVRDRARRQGDFRAAHPRADHGRLRPDLRPLHCRGCEQAVDPAACRRPAGEADHRRGADRRARVSARIRSMPASGPPMSARRWCCSIC